MPTSLRPPDSPGCLRCAGAYRRRHQGMPPYAESADRACREGYPHPSVPRVRRCACVSPVHTAGGIRECLPTRKAKIVLVGRDAHIPPPPGIRNDACFWRSSGMTRSSAHKYASVYRICRRLSRNNARREILCGRCLSWCYLKIALCSAFSAFSTSFMIASACSSVSVWSSARIDSEKATLLKPGGIGAPV